MRTTSCFTIKVVFSKQKSLPGYNLTAHTHIHTHTHTHTALHTHTHTHTQHAHSHTHTPPYTHTHTHTHHARTHTHTPPYTHTHTPPGKKGLATKVLCHFFVIPQWVKGRLFPLNPPNGCQRT